MMKWVGESPVGGKGKVVDSVVRMRAAISNRTRKLVSGRVGGRRHFRFK